MKGYRVFYGALTAALLFAGLYTGSRLCFVLFLVLFLTLLAALGLDLWTVLSLTFSQEVSQKEAEKGTSVTLHLEITNDKPFPFTHMRVRVEGADRDDDRELPLELAPRDKAVFDLAMGLRRRGERRLGMTRVELEDIFGLMPMGMDLRRLPYYRQRTVLVLPRVVEMDLPARQELHSPGGGPGAPAGREELSHLRAYVPGDPLSRVHWKASLKEGKLLTRQMEDPAGGGCLVFLDTRICDEDAADRLVECAVAILNAHLARRDGARVVASREEGLPPQLYGRAALLDTRRRLAVLSFDEADPGEEMDPEAHPVLRRLQEALSHQRPEAVYVLGSRFDRALFSELCQWDAPGFYLTEEAAGPVPVQEGVRVASLAGKTTREALGALWEESL